MIDLSHVNPIVLFVIGAMLVGVYFWMLTDRIASRIRNSPFWFVGWLGGIFILSTGGRLMMPILSGLPINDDIAVPVLFGTLVVIVFALFFVQTYRLRRQLKRG